SSAIFSCCFSSRLLLVYTLHSLFLFFFNDTAPTEIYTLSLHDALPICPLGRQLERPRRPLQERHRPGEPAAHRRSRGPRRLRARDRKSTRLNSSHVKISYAVFCLKKKKKKKKNKTHSIHLIIKI